MPDEREVFSSEISFEQGDFVDVGLQKNQVCVLPLVHVLGNTVRGLGTCFSITNDGLCMTARHVVEEGLSIITPGKRSASIDPIEQGYFGALYISDRIDHDDPKVLFGDILPMHTIHFFDLLDIALIKLNLPAIRDTGEQIYFPLHPLRLKPPSTGDLCFGVGYRQMVWSTDDDEGILQVNQTYSATRGIVEDIHLSGRDRVMLPFPCVQTSARFDAGMSGGPVFDENGQVFGVICSSFEGEHITSYASLLAPAMAMTLQARSSDGIERDVFLWEFVEGGAVQIVDEGVEAVRNDDTLTLRFENIHLTAKLGS